jgi:hypothetical protein
VTRPISLPMNDALCASHKRRNDGEVRSGDQSSASFRRLTPALMQA